MQQGTLNSQVLTRNNLQRIEAIDHNGPNLNSIIEVNPQAIEIATAPDEERQASGPRVNDAANFRQRGKFDTVPAVPATLAPSMR